MYDQDAKKPIAEYLFWTFLVAWVSEAVLILLERLAFLPEAVQFIVTYGIIGFGAGMAPMYAMAILLKKHGYIRGVKDFCRRIFRSKGIWHTIPASVICAGVLVAFYLTVNKQLDSWYIAVAAIPVMIIGGGLEEIGWRGFLQSALEEKMPFIPATALVGVIWAVWHLPLWLVRGASQSSTNFLSFVFFCIVLAFILATLYKFTESVAACVLLHAWSNALGAIFTADFLISPIGVKGGIVIVAIILLSTVVYYIVGRWEKKAIN